MSLTLFRLYESYIKSSTPKKRRLKNPQKIPITLNFIFTLKDSVRFRIVGKNKGEDRALTCLISTEQLKIEKESSLEALF